MIKIGGGSQRGVCVCVCVCVSVSVLVWRNQKAQHNVEFSHF